MSSNSSWAPRRRRSCSSAASSPAAASSSSMMANNNTSSFSCSGHSTRRSSEKSNYTTDDVLTGKSPLTLERVLSSGRQQQQLNDSNTRLQQKLRVGKGRRSWRFWYYRLVGHTLSWRFLMCLCLFVLWKRSGHRRQQQQRSLLSTTTTTNDAAPPWRRTTHQSYTDDTITTSAAADDTDSGTSTTSSPHSQNPLFSRPESILLSYFPTNYYESNAVSEDLGDFFGPAGMDFDDIQYDSIRFMKKFVRPIVNDSDEWYEEDRDELLDEIDEDREEELEHYEELDYPRPDDCHRLKWTGEMNPVCNHFHEFALEREKSLSQPFDRRHLAHGHSRDAWLFEPVVSSSNHDYDHHPNLVLKALRLTGDAGLDFSFWTASHIFKEALVMERTSASNRTMNIYGHCSTSMLVEHGYEISQRIVQGVEYDGRGRITQEDLDDIQKDDVHPFNNFTSEEKLDIALAMAEGIAIMHGHSEGVIVNDDVHPDQWLVDKDGNVKFNDFNNARILEWNPRSNSYCKCQVWIGGDYRSPEELRGTPISEKSDVWPMGANIYGLLTGLFPYYTVWERRSIERIIANGTRPTIDPRYKTRTFIEGRMAEIMEPCFEVDPEQRISIFEVVEHLRETKRIVEERKRNGIEDDGYQPKEYHKAERDSKDRKDKEHEKEDGHEKDGAVHDEHDHEDKWWNEEEEQILSLKVVGDNGVPPMAYPLGRCEGDCDDDDDCDEGLICFQRDSDEEVPGCDGEDDHGNDFCIFEDDEIDEDEEWWEDDEEGGEKNHRDA